MEFKEVESQLEGINELFDAARTEDGWNLDEEMLFSYYFIDTDVDKLEKLGIKLDDEGFDYIGVYELGEEDSDEPSGEFMLHIDKVEIHTPESLAQRNVEFQKLAEEHGIETYDGWEFGEVGEDDEDDEDDADDAEE